MNFSLLCVSDKSELLRISKKLFDLMVINQKKINGYLMYKLYEKESNQHIKQAETNIIKNLFNNDKFLNYLKPRGQSKQYSRN